MRDLARFTGTARQRITAPACPREALAAVIDASEYSYAALSRMLGRRDGYLRCFVKDGHPAALSEGDHSALADFFGLPLRGLGIRTLWSRDRDNERSQPSIKETTPSRTACGNPVRGRQFDRY